MRLDDHLESIKGIGEKTAAHFNKLGLFSVGSLLTYYPRRYDDFREPTDISALKEGETGVICACVSFVAQPKAASRIKIVTCKASDPSGEIELVWFNMPFVKYELKPGYHYVFRGKVTKKGRSLTMEQAKIYKREDYARLKGTLQPVYPLTSGLTNNAVVKAMKQSLDLAEDIPEYIPSSIRKQYDLMKKKYALTEMHFPKSEETMLDARRSLCFEEFFIFGLFIRQMAVGRERAESHAGIRDTGACEKILKSLPYSLTEDQMKAVECIKKDILSGHVMARLIQGDVGSGKTIVAALAMAFVASSGHQAAIMAPTEVLAKQHFNSMKPLFDLLSLDTVLLTGSMTAAEKKEIYKKIKDHEGADIIIGTHALFQEKVEYDDLCLCVTDEQHRFGVKQREGLGKKGEKPHILVMSATPIPRTLAMMLYGDMDISLIRSMPKNRIKVKNCVVGPQYRPTAYQFITEQVRQGHQAYIICPMVDAGDAGYGENVEEYSKALSETLGDSIIVEKLHGKMKPKDKDRIMERFANNEINVLVSTTVVEVGMNVPNATVMMIENSERFGLAQLHQLRGRVGRGDAQSYCIFMYSEASQETLERLEILKTSNDGFEIANKDLELRGPGDLFGIRQCGDMYFKIGDIYNDSDVFKEAYEAAGTLSDREVSDIVGKMYESSAKEVFKFLENYGTI